MAGVEKPKAASFVLKRGEILGIAGLVGAGRTELAMSIFGRQYGTKITGTVMRRGEVIHTRTVEEAISNGIAYVTEDRKRYGLNLIWSVAANVTGANLGGVSKYGVIDLHREIAVAEGYREALNIKTDNVARFAGTLSGGNQQKLIIGREFELNPKLLLVSQPTRGVDIGAKYEIYGIINELAAQGKAVIVISSELPELLGLSDRIYTIAEGRITGDVPREEATQERLMQLMTVGEK